MLSVSKNHFQECFRIIKNIENTKRKKNVDIFTTSIVFKLRFDDCMYDFSDSKHDFDSTTSA